MQVAATRRENLRAFDALVDGMGEARGTDARIAALHDDARSAIAGFPVPLLGPGMLRMHATLEDGNEKIGNLLEIVVAAQKHLIAAPGKSLAEAFCVAFSKRLGISVETARIRILRASHDCEFFSPELVLMLDAWIPAG
jgi:hypothetical protein